jgi:hypothetical protein
VPIKKTDTLTPLLIRFPDIVRQEQRALLQIRLAEMQRAAQDKYFTAGRPARVAKWRTDTHTLTRGPRKGQTINERHKVRKAIPPKPTPTARMLTARHGKNGLKGAIRFNVHASLPVGWIFYAPNASATGKTKPDVYGAILSERRTSWRPIERAIYTIYRSMGGSLKKILDAKLKGR